MSKGELWKGVAIRGITAVIFGVIGGLAIWCALQMVAIFGQGMGVDVRSSELYAQSHMIVHVFGAACALAIGIFYHGRNWLLFTLAIISIVGCGSYGILNMVGFTSTNRVTVAATKEARKNAAEREYEAARAALAGQIDWLQKTAVNEDGRERRRLFSEIDAKRKELASLKPPIPTAETVLADPQASTLGEITGTSARRWLLALPIPLAVLLFLAESISFVFVGHMLAAIVTLLAGYHATKDRTIAGSPEGSGGEVKSTEGSKDKPASDGATVIPIRAQSDQLQATVNSSPPVTARENVSSELPRVPAPAPNIPAKQEYIPPPSSKRLTAKEAQRDLQRIIDATGTVPTQEILAERWGRSQGWVSKLLNRSQDRATQVLGRNIFQLNQKGAGGERFSSLARG